MRLSTVLRIFSIASVLLWAATAQASDIANVTVPFGGTVAQPEEARAIIARKMQTLAPDAASAGISAIRLQSVAYTLAPSGDGYSVDGNLFIDVVPESKTGEFVALLGKKGVILTINHFGRCQPSR